MIGVHILNCHRQADSSPQCYCSAIVDTPWKIVFSCFSLAEINKFIFVSLLHTGLFVWLFDQTWWQWEYQDIHLKVFWHIDNFLVSPLRWFFRAVVQNNPWTIDIWSWTSSTWSWSPPRLPRNSTRTPPTCSPPSPLLQSPSSPDPFAQRAPFNIVSISFLKPFNIVSIISLRSTF